MDEQLRASLLKPVLMTIMAAFFSANAIVQFVQAAGLIPSGVSGLSSLFQMEFIRVFSINLNFSLLYFGINLFIIVFVFRHVGKRFLILSLLHVFLTGVLVEILPQFKISNDIFLLALFGGITNGIGSSLVLRANGSSGGTDFLAVYFSMFKNRPMWKEIMYFNVSMLIYFGWRYNWTMAFYSIIYQIASTKIIDQYHDRYKLVSLRVITKDPVEVTDAILSVVRHGITKLDGLGMYKKREKSMLYLVVNAFEVNEIVDAVKNVDAYAFIEISSVDRIEGNYRQKPLD